MAMGIFDWLLNHGDEDDDVAADPPPIRVKTSADRADGRGAQPASKAHVYHVHSGSDRLDQRT